MAYKTPNNRRPGRPPLHGETMVSITVDIPQSLRERGRKIGDRYQRPMAFLIRQALERYLVVVETNGITDTLLDAAPFEQTGT
jgi:hypothetical protein